MYASKAIAIAASVSLAVTIASCNGDSKTESPKTTQNVSVKPSSGCKLVKERRSLGRNPPTLSFDLRNSDVDNFSGETGPQCNERQLVYWGPPPPLPGGERPATVVKLFFVGSDVESDDGSAGGQPAAQTIAIGDGTELALFPGDGLFSSRFASGGTIVTVIAACAARDEANLNPAPCDDPPQPAHFLRARSIQAAKSLERQLRGRLG